MSALSCCPSLDGLEGGAHLQHAPSEFLGNIVDRLQHSFVVFTLYLGFIEEINLGVCRQTHNRDESEIEHFSEPSKVVDLEQILSTNLQNLRRLKFPKITVYLIGILCLVNILFYKTI